MARSRCLIIYIAPSVPADIDDYQTVYASQARRDRGANRGAAFH